MSPLSLGSIDIRSTKQIILPLGHIEEEIHSTDNSENSEDKIIISPRESEKLDEPLCSSKTLLGTIAYKNYNLPLEFENPPPETPIIE